MPVCLMVFVARTSDILSSRAGTQVVLARGMQIRNRMSRRNILALVAARKSRKISVKKVTLSVLAFSIVTLRGGSAFSRPPYATDGRRSRHVRGHAEYGQGNRNGAISARISRYAGAARCRYPAAPGSQAGCGRAPVCGGASRRGSGSSRGLFTGDDRGNGQGLAILSRFPLRDVQVAAAEALRPALPQPARGSRWQPRPIRRGGRCGSSMRTWIPG